MEQIEPSVGTMCEPPIRIDRALGWYLGVGAGEGWGAGGVSGGLSDKKMEEGRQGQEKEGGDGYLISMRLRNSPSSRRHIVECLRDWGRDIEPSVSRNRC